MPDLQHVPLHLTADQYLLADIVNKKEFEKKKITEKDLNDAAVQLALELDVIEQRKAIAERTRTQEAIRREEIEEKSERLAKEAVRLQKLLETLYQPHNTETTFNSTDSIYANASEMLVNIQNELSKLRIAETFAYLIAEIAKAEANLTVKPSVMIANLQKAGLAPHQISSHQVAVACAMKAIFNPKPAPGSKKKNDDDWDGAYSKEDNEEIERMRAFHARLQASSLSLAAAHLDQTQTIVQNAQAKIPAHLQPAQQQNIKNRF